MVDLNILIIQKIREKYILVKYAHGGESSIEAAGSSIYIKILILLNIALTTIIITINLQLI